MQVATGKTVTTVRLVKFSASYRLNFVDSTEKERLTKVLKEKWAQLLIAHSSTGQISWPGIRIVNAGGGIGWYTTDLAAHSTERTPLIVDGLMSPAVQRDGGDGSRIEVSPDIHPDSEKGSAPISEFSLENRHQVRATLVNKKAHAIHIREERFLQHAQWKIGIE